MAEPTKTGIYIDSDGAPKQEAFSLYERKNGDPYVALGSTSTSGFITQSQYNHAATGFKSLSPYHQGILLEEAKKKYGLPVPDKLQADKLSPPEKELYQAALKRAQLVTVSVDPRTKAQLTHVSLDTSAIVIDHAVNKGAALKIGVYDVAGHPVSGRSIEDPIVVTQLKGTLPRDAASRVIAAIKRSTDPASLVTSIAPHIDPDKRAKMTTALAGAGAKAAAAKLRAAPSLGM